MHLKIILVWLAIMILGCFCLTTMAGSDPVTIAVIPEVPRADEPVICTFKLNNPDSILHTIDFSFYANGELLQHGTSSLGPQTSKTYQYVYNNPLALGEQVNFVVHAETDGERCEKIVSLPSYPPQVMSSFVSFASFSTSVMGFMASSSYYEDSFSTPDEGMNTSLVISVVLILLLIFIELSEPLPSSHLVLGRLRIRFTMLSAILFIIFIGIVYTKIVMILVV